MTTITTVVVESTISAPQAIEEYLIAETAKELGMDVVYMSKKNFLKGRLQMTSEMMAVGNVDFVKFALKQLGKDLPEANPYPDCLSHLLYRTTKRLNSLLDAKRMIEQGQTLFVKPTAWKRFTGFVASDPYDLRFNGAGKHNSVFISTPVTFVSEWRAYVVNGKVVEIKYAKYGGDRTVEPDHFVIHDAVNRLSESGSPSGYVIDFGVLDTGETALIEMNDGFSFGAYDDVRRKTYWDVTYNRWLELVA